MSKPTRTRVEDTLRHRLREVLGTLSHTDFAGVARDVLEVLGYKSDRTLPVQTGEVDDFIEAFPAQTPDNKSEREFRSECLSIRLLFQVTGAEVAAQKHLFDSSGFDKQNTHSFVFVAADLKGETYPRGRYALFTREINKRLNQPTVVLFKTAGHLLTLAFVHRRLHKLDPNRDVLGAVSLIREVNPENAHRAHLDILSDLSLASRLQWMDSNSKRRNFDGLLQSWLDALDTEELNKRFYRELFKWFETAIKEARFPATEAQNLDSEQHVIRLITRLLFIWFIKEKGLINSDLFTEGRIRSLIKDYDSETGDSYYRVVLQNLFFATLNTEISRRGFSKKEQATHRNFSLYRHRAEMADPDALLDLFAHTPFINGGLFDCLDSEESTSRGGYRIDCFSDNPSHRDLLSIPNRLFFGPTGLVDLFNRYRFTVEENTPIEQEVALDPELLGKVFENLLAAFNPETQVTARKQTGSYYTPREVVDYMVEEALIAFLSDSIPPYDGHTNYWRERLRYLLHYDDAFDDAEELFVPSERDSIIRAIADIKVLDPAVGSGAFPMAVLHRLTLALGRLDSDNQEWERLQRDRAGTRAKAAFDTGDHRERDAELTEISDTFEKYRDSDFGRKLYLIQNSIFGVDIQTIACQIAKLRFFISLTIEQTPQSDPADNYGIKPLPNLETRFVAADTLQGLRGWKTRLVTVRGAELQQALQANRRRHYHAATRNRKLEVSRENRALRSELATELENLGMRSDQAERIATWDPYDQNASADWFAPEYMFDAGSGFDIVIGNPPYIQLQRDTGKLRRKYKKAGYQTFASTGDVYGLFYEQGTRLLKPGQGILAYITSNSWMKAKYGEKLRAHLSARHTPLKLIEMGKDVFDATVDTNILLLREGTSRTDTGSFPAVDIDAHSLGDFPPAEELWGQILPSGSGPWSVMTPVEQGILDKIRLKGTRLAEWDVNINYGIKTGLNDAFIIDSETRDTLIAEDPRSEEILKPVLRGRDIRRFKATWAERYLVATHNGYGDTPPVDPDDYPAVKRHLQGYQPRLGSRYDQGRTPYNLRNCAYQAEFTKEKLFWIDLSPEGRFAYWESEMYCVNTAFFMTGPSLKYLQAVLNSTLMTWLMHKTALTSGMGEIRWIAFVVEQLPIPKVALARQRPFVRIVNDMLAVIANSSSADIGDQKREIDRMVYDLYGLTEEESGAVEAWFTAQR